MDWLMAYRAFALFLLLAWWFFGIVAIAGGQDRKLVPIRWGALTGACGITLFAFQEELPRPLPFVLGNALMVLSPFLIAQGLWGLSGRASSRLLVAAPPALMAAVGFRWGVQEELFAPRFLASSVLLALGFAHGLHAVLHWPKRWLSRLLAFIMGFLVLVLIARILVKLGLGVPWASAFDLHPANAIILGALMFGLAFLALALSILFFEHLPRADPAQGERPQRMGAPSPLTGRSKAAPSDYDDPAPRG